MASPSQIIVQDYQKPEDMDKGINAMLSNGYGLHSWRIDPLTRCRSVAYGRFICVFALMVNVPPKSEGIRAR